MRQHPTNTMLTAVLIIAALALLVAIETEI